MGSAPANVTALRRFPEVVHGLARVFPAASQRERVARLRVALLRPRAETRDSCSTPHEGLLDLHHATSAAVVMRGRRRALDLDPVARELRRRRVRRHRPRRRLIRHGNRFPSSPRPPRLSIEPGPARGVFFARPPPPPPDLAAPDCPAAARAVSSSRALATSLSGSTTRRNGEADADPSNSMATAGGGNSSADSLESGPRRATHAIREPST